MPARRISIQALEGIPDIVQGDDLAAKIVSALQRVTISEPAILVVAQKVISKSEGRFVALDSVVPSSEALELAAELDRDPRMVQVILGETRRIVRVGHGVLVVETRNGFVCANAGVDASNAPAGTVVLLPPDPDASARRLQERLESALGIRMGVIISDTFGRPWRQGLTNIALGVAGLSPFLDYRGQLDLYRRPLVSTLMAVADELASAAELVMGKTSGTPVAIIEGFEYCAGPGSGQQLIRPAGEDLFR